MLIIISVTEYYFKATAVSIFYKATSNTRKPMATDIDRAQQTAYLFAEQDVIGYVVSVLEKINQEKLAEQIRATVSVESKMSIALELPDTDITLNIALGCVARDYKPDICLPTAAEQDFLMMVSGAHQFVTIYWKHWLMVHSDLADQLKHLDSAFETLRSDPPNHTSLYFDAEWPKRIGIVFGFTDKAGQTYVRR